MLKIFFEKMLQKNLTFSAFFKHALSDFTAGVCNVIIKDTAFCITIIKR